VIAHERPRAAVTQGARPAWKPYLTKSCPSTHPAIRTDGNLWITPQDISGLLGSPRDALALGRPDPRHE
jgi:hypothetical protein